MKKKALSLFTRIGLGEREEKIYKSLLTHGPLSISEMSRRTGVPRVSIYSVLPHLLFLGLISRSPKGKYKIYSAESPKKFKAVLTDILVDSEIEIAEMEETELKNSNRPQITYGEGHAAIKSVLSDVVHSLKKGDTYYRYSSESALKREQMPHYLPYDYRKIRDEKELERSVITNEPTRNKLRNALGRDVKVIPNDFDMFDYNITQVIYGDKVAIIDYNNETTITIENAVLAKFQKKIFKLLFREL